ncbi:MAG: biotin--[acetyl-CoA-carboxylase] ligase [Treponema sp.]|nr:biotin--[acetyl-CoA-carboxylase] ligase [Treponema sp.]
MEILPISNPFGAPVYHVETTTSTMDEGRRLAGAGSPHGTAICADYQEAGRGRIRERSWDMERGRNLACTVLLRFGGMGDIPPALTLRTGLAVLSAIAALVPALADRLLVKWPNDIMIRFPEAGGAARKTAGILTEGDGGAVFTGIGVNVAQREFPPAYRRHAASLALAAEPSGAAGPEPFPPGFSFRLLEEILFRLHAELTGGKDWRSRLEERLYRRGGEVTFIDGAAGSENAVEGRLTGIGPAGELLIVPRGEEKARSFVTGELLVY